MYKPIILKNFTAVAKLLFLLNAVDDIYYAVQRIELFISRYLTSLEKMFHIKLYTIIF